MDTMQNTALQMNKIIVKSFLVLDAPSGLDASYNCKIELIRSHFLRFCFFFIASGSLV